MKGASLILWIIIGMVTMCGEQVSKADYFLCWLVLMANLITNFLD